MPRAVNHSVLILQIWNSRQFNIELTDYCEWLINIRKFDKDLQKLSGCVNAKYD